MQEQLNKDFSLSEKTILVTGAGGILGQQFVTAFLRQGAFVVALDKSSAAITELSEKHEITGQFRGVAGDITDRDFLESVGRWLDDNRPGIDVLFNNAAAKSANFFEPFETFPLEDWNEVMGVNLTAAMLCCQVFGSRMVKRSVGSIINTLSVYGVVAPDQRIYEGSEYEGRAINTPAIYSASKAGLWGLTKYLAAYWGNKGIRVNALTPGGVFSGQNTTFVQRYSARVPLGRMAEKNELVGAAIFLASDASSYITGQNIVVDGGLTVW